MKNAYINTDSGIKRNTLYFIITFCLLFVILNVKAQHPQCGSEVYLQEQLKADPTLRLRMESIESGIQQSIANKGTAKGLAGAITIPVVVHVVYNTDAQNISDAQIQSQIDVLNQDFSRTNADRVNTPLAFQSYAANPNIQFVLAKRDPNGNATNGITRTFTTRTSFTQNNYVKFDSYGGKNAWPRDQYLNIWVCNLSYAGYSTYPGGTASIDGVVIKYQCFGNIGTLLSASKKGRTTTHEIGHWLNLEHIWGLSVCGDDVVGDTPTQEKSNSGFPVFPHVSSCSPNANGDMFMNYMDYSDDAARNMFTIGQCDRMNAVLNGTRSSLLSSLGGIAPGGGAVVCNVPAGLNVSSITTAGATLNWTSTGALSYNVKYKPTSSTSWTTANTSSASLSISGLTASTNYEFQVAGVCSSSSLSAFSSSVLFTTVTPVVVCNIPAGLTVSSITTGGATLNWTASGATSYNIRYKPTSSTSWITASTSSTSLSISGLTASTGYEFQVAGVCSSSSLSAFSSSVLFTTVTPVVVCNIPEGLTVSSITTGEATLNWTASGAASYNVRYKPTSSISWITASTSSPSLSISGLTASTGYEFQVAGVCSSSSTSTFSASGLFTTTAVSPANTVVTIGNSSATMSDAPYGTALLKEHVQFIITKAELLAAGYNPNNNVIQSLSFFVTTASAQVMNGFTIKMAHISTSDFANTTFLSTANAKTVHGSNFTASGSGWNKHVFSNPFTFNGTDNLLVDIVWINTSSSTSSVVEYTPTSTNKTLYFKAKNKYQYINNVTTGTLSLNRANMQFEFGNPALKMASEAPVIGESAYNNDLGMELYPNPASYQLNIGYNSSSAGEVATVSIFDFTGALISSFTNISESSGRQNISLDLNLNSNFLNLSNGIYICSMELKGSHVKMKFILNRN